MNLIIDDDVSTIQLCRALAEQGLSIKFVAKGVGVIKPIEKLFSQAEINKLCGTRIKPMSNAAADKLLKRIYPPTLKVVE